MLLLAAALAGPPAFPLPDLAPSPPSSLPCPPKSQSGNHELGRGRGGLGAVYHPGQEHQGQWLRGAYSAGKGIAWRGKREGGGEEEGRVEGSHTQSEKAMNHSRASPTSSPPSSPSKGAVHAEDPSLWGALDHADHASGTCVLVIPCSPSLAPLLLLTLPRPSVTQLRGTEHEPSLILLEIFAYGTYADYQSTLALCFALPPSLLPSLPPSLLPPFQLPLTHTHRALLHLSSFLPPTEQRESAKLPELTAPQLRKLRQLTLVTLAHKHEVSAWERGRVGREGGREGGRGDELLGRTCAHLEKTRLSKRHVVIGITSSSSTLPSYPSSPSHSHPPTNRAFLTRPSSKNSATSAKPKTE